MRYRSQTSSSAGMPYSPAPLREGRTGFSREEKSRYHRRLLKLLKQRAPKGVALSIITGDAMPGHPPPKDWGTLPARRETIAILRQLQAGHTASKVGPKVSISEVLDAVLAAGIPVLLSQGGWSLGVSPAPKSKAEPKQQS